jgi:hypothetical protein
MVQTLRSETSSEAVYLKTRMNLPTYILFASLIENQENNFENLYLLGRCLPPKMLISTPKKAQDRTVVHRFPW